jgi:YidC/Oxa1 family membrane protein insertase
MDKQTVTAFVLIGIILMVWLYMTTPTNPPEQPKKPTTQKIDTVVEQKDTKQIVNKDKSDSLSYGRFFTKSSIAENIITIENDHVYIQLTNKGGKIKKYFLKNYYNWYANKLPSNAAYYEKNIQLINANKGSGYDIAFITSDGKSISTADLDFIPSISSDKKISGNDSVIITYSTNAGDSGLIKKTYVFYGNKYNSRFDLELIKINDLISGGQYDFVWNSGLKFVEENSVDEANYSNASIFYGGEHVVVDAPGGGEKIEKDFNGKVEWLAIKNKYFASIIIPDNANNIDGAFIKGYTQHYENGGLKEFYSARLKVPFKNKDYEKQSFTVFIGPASYDLIKDFGKDLTSIIDFGSFFGLKFIVRPIAEYVFLPLFKFLHSIIPNYGVVIIIFSLIIKVVTHPLTRQSMYSMKKMQLLQPKITEIKARLKDDPQKMNKETMKLYSTYGINPAGGCLPLILQMPIFIALWGMFQSAIELRQQPFLGWINDLSRPDIILTLGFKIPIFGIDQISGLALLMGITTFVQQKMTVKDPQQQMLIYIMPIMLTALFMSFPAGLNLYYFLFNLFSIAQQYYINHTHKDMELVPVKNPKKQGGFLQRMMEAAENKAKQQQVRKKR